MDKLSKDKLLSVIIPAYNEAAVLPNVLPDLINTAQKENWDITIVNDGSSDNTKEILNNYADEPILKVIHHKVNRGYGGAIKTGINNAETEFVITFDADGQHRTEDVKMLLTEILESDADMIVGNRGQSGSNSMLRSIGKWIIRRLAKWLMPLNIEDLNSGLKIYRTDLARKYLQLCPDSMAYSDIIALVFISNRHLVLERPVKCELRLGGESTIGIHTALETMIEILHISVLFNPMKVFFTLAFISFITGIFWSIRVFISSHILTSASFFPIFMAALFFLLGLVAEQLCNIRKALAVQNQEKKSNFI